MKLALHHYEESLCACGHSGLLSFGREGVGEYDAQSVVCHACAARERAQKAAKDTPGRKLWVRDLHDDPRDDDEALTDEPGGDDD